MAVLDSAVLDSAVLDSAGLDSAIYHKISVADPNTFQFFNYRIPLKDHLEIVFPCFERFNINDPERRGE